MKIHVENNREVKYLYNKVLDVVRKEKLPATFTRDFIDLPRADSKVLEALKAYNIKYSKD